MNLEPAPWAENPDAFTQEAVDTHMDLPTNPEPEAPATYRTGSA